MLHAATLPDAQACQCRFRVVSWAATNPTRKRSQRSRCRGKAMRSKRKRRGTEARKCSPLRQPASRTPRHSSSVAAGRPSANKRDPLRRTSGGCMVRLLSADNAWVEVGGLQYCKSVKQPEKGASDRKRNHVNCTKCRPFWHMQGRKRLEIGRGFLIVHEVTAIHLWIEAGSPGQGKIDVGCTGASKAYRVRPDLVVH